MSSAILPSLGALVQAAKRATPPPAPVPYTGMGMITDPWLLGWAFGLLGAHLVLQVVLGAVKSPFQVKPGVAAHQFVCFVPFVYAAAMGTKIWLFSPEAAAMHTGTYVDRLYGTCDDAFLLTRFMVGFQLYDLLATGLEPSLRKAEHLAHHSSTLLTAMGGIAAGGPYFNYYAAFFFGFTEISSMPLAFVDLFRQLPKLADANPALNELLRTTFAVSFLIIRVFYFPYVMLSKWWPDLYTAYTSSDVRCAGYVFGWMAFSSTFLTFLQLFWGYKILRVVLKGNLGGKDKSAIKSETD